MSENNKEWIQDFLLVMLAVLLGGAVICFVLLSIVSAAHITFYYLNQYWP